MITAWVNYRTHSALYYLCLDPFSGAVEPGLDRALEWHWMRNKPLKLHFWLDVLSLCIASLIKAEHSQERNSTAEKSLIGEV